MIYGSRWWWWCRVTTSNNKHDLLRESVCACVCEGINIDFVNLVTTCEARSHARHTRIRTEGRPVLHTMFTGTLRLKICEACGLRPTDFQTRHTMTFGRLGDQQLIDPYVSIDVDQNFIGKGPLANRSLTTKDPCNPQPYPHSHIQSCIIEDTQQQ